MNLISLNTSMGNPRIDETVRSLIGIFEAVFPSRIRGYYIEGSYADATAVATSDIDLIVVFKGDFIAETERAAATQLVADCAALSAKELDIEIVDEHGLERGVVPMFKLASVCVYGEDIREQLTLLPITEWTHQRMHAAYWLMNRVFGRPNSMSLPLDYPKPDDEFGGYTQRTTRLPDDQDVPSTRDLIRVTGWMATGLLALQAGHYVTRKRDCSQLYEQYIGDKWTSLLEELFRRCRGEWGYLVPADEPGREQLRALCRATLGFENHFLGVYRDFVLNELRDAHDQHRLHALWVLEQIPYHDEQINTLLHHHRRDTNSNKMHD